MLQLPTMIQLSLLKDDQEVMKYFLNKETTTIGRSSQNDICLPDPAISRVHLSIVRKGEQYIATDKSTENEFQVRNSSLTTELKLVVGTFYSHPLTKL